MKGVAALLIIPVLAGCGQQPSPPPPAETPVYGPQIIPQPFCPDNTAPNGYQEYYVTIGSNDYAILNASTGDYLSLIKPGVYTTSDGSGCEFQVNADASITVLN